MAFRKPNPPTFYEALHKRAHLVHSLSKDEQALELARLVIRLLPQLETVVREAGYDGRGSVSAQTNAIKSFISGSCDLALVLSRAAE